MTNLRKLERDFVYADLAAVSGLLEQLGDEDFVARFGLEARLQELKSKLARLEKASDEPTASAVLFFGGQPVIGSHGIESEFAGAAVFKFQDIVAKVLAGQAGGLGQRGVVPHKPASVLHITNVVRGSFGFLLEEIRQHGSLVETPLKKALNEATHLLDAFGEPDEEQFRATIEATDQRVLVTAQEFFDLMRQNQATLRLVAGNEEWNFGAEAVARAAERATSTSVEEEEETISGQLSGVLPEAHLFEFRTSTDHRTIRGKVDPKLTADQLARFNKELVDLDATARVRVKRVLRDGAVVRENFTLLELEERSS